VSVSAILNIRWFADWFLKQEATVILKAVVSEDLLFWHCFFGVPGSHNNINVLNFSPLFTNLLNGISPKCEYTINVNWYTQGYYLADGIYPDYSTIVKTLSQPEGLDCKASDPFFWNSTLTINYINSVLSSILEKCKRHCGRM
jgi:hypothetical protein